MNFKFSREEYHFNSPDHSPRKEKPSWKLKDFKVAEFLGKGKFGLVYRAIETRTSHKFAMKIMSKEIVKNYDMVKQLKREIEVHTRLK
jgi:serine/threonine protein kinase